MNFLKYALGGVIGGIFGTAVWGAIAYFANAEVGWIAWGIGFVVGFGVRYMADEEQGMMPGVVALLIAVISVLAGKYLAVELAVRNFTGELTQLSEVGESDMTVELADEVVKEWQQQGWSFQFPPGMTLEEADEAHEYPPGVWDEATKRWAALGKDEQQKRLAAAGESRRQLAQVFAGAMREQGFLASFSLFDVLWFLLAAGTAFRIGSGGFGEED